MLKIWCIATMRIYNISTIRLYNISTMCIYNCYVQAEKTAVMKKYKTRKIEFREIIEVNDWKIKIQNIGNKLKVE